MAQCQFRTSSRAQAGLAASYGFGDGTVGSGEFLETLMDGVRDSGPALSLNGGVVRMGGNKVGEPGFSWARSKWMG